MKTAKQRAEALHEEAMAFDDAGETDLALNKYFEALALDMARPTTHYNIGLIFKYRNQWADSFRYNKRAVELAPDDEAANWNLAIAATALHDWKTARAVWGRLGMPVGDDEGPIKRNFGSTPVRLNPDESGEVVWGQRIDPVRVRISNIPYAKSGFRYGDVVLHDGAPVGYRLHEDREYPVFNVLELFSSSQFSTFEGQLSVGSPQDIDALRVLCEDLGIEFEDWTMSVRNLCKQCSDGRPHEKHDHERKNEWQDRHLVGFASLQESTVREALKRWQRRGRGLELLTLALGPLI